MGARVGLNEGATDGPVGAIDGCDGLLVGESDDGFRLGLAEGAKVGLNEGATDGCFVDGICEGPVGAIDGASVGAVGLSVGTRHLLKVLSS